MTRAAKVAERRWACSQQRRAAVPTVALGVHEVSAAPSHSDVAGLPLHGHLAPGSTPLTQELPWAPPCAGRGDFPASLEIALTEQEGSPVSLNSRYMPVWSWGPPLCVMTPCREWWVKTGPEEVTRPALVP